MWSALINLHSRLLGLLVGVQPQVEVSMCGAVCDLDEYVEPPSCKKTHAETPHVVCFKVHAATKTSGSKLITRMHVSPNCVPPAPHYRSCSSNQAPNENQHSCQFGQGMNRSQCSVVGSAQKAGSNISLTIMQKLTQQTACKCSVYNGYTLGCLQVNMCLKK